MGPVTGDASPSSMGCVISAGNRGGGSGTVGEMVRAERTPDTTALERGGGAAAGSLGCRSSSSSVEGGVGPVT